MVLWIKERFSKGWNTNQKSRPVWLASQKIRKALTFLLDDFLNIEYIFVILKIICLKTLINSTKLSKINFINT